MLYAGIDAGSRAIKAVLLQGAGGEIVRSGVAAQGVRQAELAAGLFDRVLGEVGLVRSQISGLIATGHGRDAIDFAGGAVTEITCHARGVHHLHPEARTVIDIGGQDSKVLRLQEGGQVRDFVMNDRCAAGTGRFLEVVADRLDLPLEHLGESAARAEQAAAISSMCVVFAETEIIGLLAAGESPENIAAGVQDSIASRLASMAGRRAREPVYFTGGVARIPGMERALEAAFGLPVRVSQHPQLTGALGAALIARERAR